jgi:dienelactone hydrolase
VQAGELGNGSESMLGDMAIYTAAGCPSSNVGLIVVYDVFAFKVANTRAQCDRLATLLSCHVVLPDFYRGGVSPMSDPSLGDFMTWVKSGNRTWESVQRDLDTTIAHLKTKGCEKFAVLGFCWGGYIALEAAISGKFACCIGVHAAMKLTGDATGQCLDQISRLQSPLMLLQACNDPDLKATAEVHQNSCCTSTKVQILTQFTLKQLLY